MATANSTVVVVRTSGGSTNNQDPLASKAGKPNSFRELLRAFARNLLAICAGAKHRVTVIIGTAAASCTATIVTAVSGNKVTINGKDVTAARLKARQTFTLASTANNDTAVLNGVTFTAKTTVGADPVGNNFFTRGVSDTADAAALAAAINACQSAGVLGLIDATSAAGVVTVRAKADGTAANSYATTASGNITAGAATMANGAAASGDQWDYGDNDTESATNLAAAINASSQALISDHVTASSAAGVVTITAIRTDEAGNLVNVQKTGSPITLAGVTNNLMTGGTQTSKSL